MEDTNKTETSLWAKPIWTQRVWSSMGRTCSLFLLLVCVVKLQCFSYIILYLILLYFIIEKESFDRNWNNSLFWFLLMFFLSTLDNSIHTNVIIASYHIILLSILLLYFFLELFFCVLIHYIHIYFGVFFIVREISLNSQVKMIMTV